MPNICGVFDPSLSKANIEEKNEQQISAVDIPGVRYSVHKLRRPGCAIAHLDHGILENGRQPVDVQDGRLSVFLDGEIYNGAELRSRYVPDLSHRELSNPELCGLLFFRLGPALFEKLNGLFVLIIYDTRDDRLVIANDRFGFRPFFYCSVGSALIFGSELKAITAIDSQKAVDELGLLELFSYGQHVADRTWLKGCRKLMPATILEQDAQSLRESRYWHYAYSEGAPTLDQETYFTGYRCLMDSAVERCMAGNKRIGVFLSGGYDSRVVAASIRVHHLPIDAFTFGEPASRDVLFARELAQALHLRHIVLQNDRPFLARVMQPVVWRTEGMLPFANTTSMRFHADLQASVDIILVGLLGEFGGSHTWPRLLVATTRQQAMNAIFQRFVISRQALVRELFNPQFYERHFPALRDAFHTSFDGVRNDHPLNVADCWNYTNVQHRSSFHAPSADRHRFEVRAPHMDCELVDFLLAIPPMARIEQRVYKKMIAYGYPQIRSVPCTNSGRPVNPHFALEYGRMAVDLISRKLGNRVLQRLTGRRELGREFHDLHTQFCKEPELNESFLQPLLREGAFPSDIFDHGGIQRLADEQFSQKKDRALLLSLLLSWGLAAKSMLYGTCEFDRDAAFSLEPDA